MGVINRVKIIKPHASGWPFIAIIALSGFIIGTVFGIPFIFSICFALVAIYLFRIQLSTISLDQNAIVAPLNGTITHAETNNLPYELVPFYLPYKNIGIRSGLLSAASLHAPASLKIIQKQKIEDTNRRSILIKALILDSIKNNNSGEIIMIFSSSMSFLYPECSVEVQDTLSKGQNFGFLPFGGKLDLLLSDNFSTSRVVNQTCISGETILAVLN